MGELDMTREALCARLGCASRTLDKWLLPSGASGYREMDDVVWALVREILAHEKRSRRTGT